MYVPLFKVLLTVKQTLSRIVFHKKHMERAEYFELARMKSFLENVAEKREEKCLTKTAYRKWSTVIWQKLCVNKYSV